MKYILLLCFLLPVFLSFGQKYAIVDRYYKKPIVFTDTIIKDKTPAGLIIYSKDLDSLTHIISQFRDIKDLGMNRTPLNAKEYSTEAIKTTIISVTKPFGDSYDITITVDTDVSQHSFKICESRINLPDNQKKIRAIYAYLKNGRKAGSDKLL